MVRLRSHISRELVPLIPVGLIALALAVTAIAAPPTSAASQTGDRAALVALYRATGGPNWRNDTNWLSDRPLDAWYGVTTNDSGRVTGLDLHDNELRGQIPPELKGLSGLMRLHLSDNRLSGQIPSELGSLFHLRHLFLDGNELDGKIPPELSKLSNLVTLHLGANSLTGQIPPELGRLSRIRQLFLNDNDLSGQIPPELGGLFYLELLHLTNNALSGQIPPELAGLSDLTDLFLQGNRTFRCPLDDAAFREWLKGIRNQRGLFCSYAGDRAALVALYNATDGPNWRDNTNWLADGPLAAWYGVTTDDRGRVTGLKLRYNALSGQIPPELGSLSKLTRLDLGGNALSGQIPPELSRLNRLSHLFLQGNRTFRCPLDDAAFREWLKGIRNQRGLFCSYAGDRAALVALYNATDGPNWWGNTNWLADGPLAAWYGVTTDDRGRVTGLKLRFNALSGQIPPELGSLSKLTRLDLGNNFLSGKLPPQLGSLSDLTHLDLDRNTLSGEIPAQLGSLSDLTHLDLRYNRLSGEIPAQLGSLSDLTHLFLSENELIGQIPPELGSLSNLTHLSLSENELIGYIPPQLGGLSNLQSLSLNHNDLSGPIPSELGDLENLEVLSLDGNRLISENSFQRFPGNPWGIPWGNPWDSDWLAVARAVGRLVAMPVLVLGLFVFVDPPGARRAWDRRGERFGRQRSPRGLPPA